MEEVNGITLAVPGTVTISTEDYTELVTSRAYLSVIMEAKNAKDKSYVVDEVVEVISRLVHPVITAAEAISGASEVEPDA